MNEKSIAGGLGSRKYKTKFVPCQQFLGLLIGRLPLARFPTRGAILGANPNAGGSTAGQRKRRAIRWRGAANSAREVGNPLNTRDTRAGRRLSPFGCVCRLPTGRRQQNIHAHRKIEVAAHSDQGERAHTHKKVYSSLSCPLPVGCVPEIRHLCASE